MGRTPGIELQLGHGVNLALMKGPEDKWVEWKGREGRVSTVPLPRRHKKVRKSSVLGLRRERSVIGAEGAGREASAILMGAGREASAILMGVVLGELG